MKYPWLRLLRLPNLLTVPGDPLAGFLITAAALPLTHHILLGAGVSLLIYMAGLILNDVADYEIDLKERPERPIPSGAVKRRTAAVAGAALLAVALLMAYLLGPPPFLTALLLTALVLLYTFVTPRSSLVGLITMGLCRAVNLLFGVAIAATIADLAPATIPHAAWLSAALIGLYISAVSLLAAGEMEEGRLGLKRWLPLLTAIAGLYLVGITLAASRHFLIYVAIAMFAISRIVWQTIALGTTPPRGTIPPAIGNYIRTLMLLQAAFCATRPDGLPIAALLIIMQPVAARLGRLFYAS